MKIEKSSRRLTGVMLALLIVSAGLTSACKGKPQEEALNRPRIDHVTVMKMTPSVVDEMYETTGTVRSHRTSQVAGRTMGVVTSLLVREGDVVRSGQLLLTIDDREAAQRLHAASMALESARQNKMLTETTWQRYKNLYDEKALTRQEMDQMETRKNVARADYERAKAMTEEARTHRSFTRVTAPVSGRIVQKHIDVGSMANPGLPLLTIEEGGNFYVEAAVDERLRSKIKTGMEAELIPGQSDGGRKGVIRQVLPAIDPRSRTFIVKIDVGTVQVRSGLFVRVRIPVGQKETLLVPDRAIVRKGQLTGVYTVDPSGVATYRLIRTGLVYPGGVEVISGLASGEGVITGGVERAKDGGLLAGGKTP